ncbi:hypothetical protein AGMMS4956_06470 [Bacteroidia bacterium]|nr:hypothetical protein AGMMS4956_06470 [Bacteroidia bacterium]
MVNAFKILVILLLSTQVSFAQISAEDADFTDSTHYFTLDITKTIQQDNIFVFFAPKRGALTAAQPNGQLAVFSWEQLDTSAFPRQQYLPFFADTFALQDSSTIDTLGYGCYRVLTEIVRVDTIARDTFVSISTLPQAYQPINTQVKPPQMGYGYDIANIDTISHDTTFVGYTLRTALQPADTLRAWVVIDSFALCDVQINPFGSDSCDDPNLEGTFFVSETGICSRDLYFRYTYYDLIDTTVSSLNFPDHPSDLYIPSVKWTPSTDIHKDADGIKIDEGWDKMLNTTVPRPLWDATYKLELENYFGNKAQIISDTVIAHAVFAKMELAIGKKGTSGIVEWEQFVEELADSYDAPLWLRVKNNSVNAGAESTFEWSFYGNNFVDSSPARSPEWAYVSYVQDEEVERVDDYYYVPGEYPIKLVVTNQFGCKDSLTVLLKIADFLIEKNNFTAVLSPRSSTGENLYFKIKDPNAVHSVTAFEVSVLNRYGQLMFSSNDLNFEWDGKIRGTNSYAPDGVYFYIVKAEGENWYRKRIRQTIKGNVHLFGTR